MDRLQGQAMGSTAAKNYAESKFSRRVEDMELMQIMQQEKEDVRQKELNYIAEIVIMRISDKLRGLEFNSANKPSIEQEGQNAFGGDKQQSSRKDVQEQVDILIKEATCHENLSSCYIGWCPYW